MIYPGQCCKHNSSTTVTVTAIVSFPTSCNNRFCFNLLTNAYIVYAQLAGSWQMALGEIYTPSDFQLGLTFRCFAITALTATYNSISLIEYQQLVMYVLQWYNFRSETSGNQDHAIWFSPVDGYNAEVSPCKWNCRGYLSWYLGWQVAQLWLCRGFVMAPTMYFGLLIYRVMYY